MVLRTSIGPPKAMPSPASQVSLAKTVKVTAAAWIRATPKSTRAGIGPSLGVLNQSSTTLAKHTTGMQTNSGRACRTMLKATKLFIPKLNKGSHHGRNLPVMLRLYTVGSAEPSPSPESQEKEASVSETDEVDSQ